MLNDALKSKFADFKLVNKPTVVVTVGFKSSDMMDKLANAVYSEMVRVAGFRAFTNFDVTEEDVRQYLCTTAWMRRCKAAKAFSKSLASYKPYEDTVAIPTIWYQVLVSIGQAYDSDHAVRFVPGTEIDENELIEPSKLKKVSDLMFTLQRNGLKVVAGIPRAVEGDLGFMAIEHLAGESYSYRRDHPVYGFLASFFTGQEISQALGALVSITYGFDTDYDLMLAQVMDI